MPRLIEKTATFSEEQYLDARAKLDERLSHHRVFVDQIWETRDEETEHQKEIGLRRLLMRLVTNSTEYSPGAFLQNDDEVKAFKHNLYELLVECTRNTVTSLNCNEVESSIWKEGVLRPRQAKILVSHFGLIDGRFKSTREVSEDLGIGKDKVPKNMNKVIDTLLTRRDQWERFVS